MDTLFTSAALTSAAIAGFFGLVLGSIAPHDPEAASKIDGKGALIWGFAAAGIVAAITERLSTGAWHAGLFTFSVGILLIAYRFISTRPARVPKGGDVKLGINRAEGETPAKKFKNAERAYNKASFSNGRYYATRSPRDFRYNQDGAPAENLELLRPGLEHPNTNTFSHLVLLVRELPDEPGQAAVIAVEVSAKIVVTADSITLPDLSLTVSAKSIAGMVGYAWR